MSDSNMISAMVGGIITAIAAYAIFLFIIWILTVIAKWRIFTKAGLAGWKSIIPIYSDYCTYRIAWNKKEFWISLLLSLAGGILSSMGGDQENAPAILSLLSLVAYIGVLVYFVKMNVKLAHRYGFGTGFGVGLIFLNTIFLLIMGLGGSRYLGNPEEGLYGPGSNGGFGGNAAGGNGNIVDEVHPNFDTTDKSGNVQ